ncbi:restriction endonuclease subunit S [Enterovibrio makurazakiensis]|uniref:restriction endonuclease subunit S n=1 Tax=Enterovibrio makurazakiensis TaxID=2910232 RepID=UPI003D261E45
MVPNGWERKPLEKVAEIQTGVAKGKKGLKDPIEVPYLRVANVQDGNIDLSVVKTIQIERHQLERYSLQVGDVLMTEGGDFDKLGRGDVWQGQIVPCLNQNHVFAVRPNKQILLPYFLATLSASNYGKTYFLSCAKRSTNLASINSTQLKEFPVLLPPLPEQRKIAQILSTWDKAITTTEKLIATSKQQKKALMQQLLTGKKRFKDQNGNTFPKWIYESIGKYLVPYKELAPANTKIPVLTSSRTGLYLQERSVINEGDYGVLPLGYFTYRHMSDDLIFKFNVNRTWDRGAVSKEYPIFKTVGLDSYFLESNLNEGDDFKRFAIQQKQGGTRTRLYFKSLKELKLKLPCLEEQQKIASVLTAADKEIELLEVKLAHLKQEKKALMQQLLTGKRRVKEDVLELGVATPY